VRLVHEQASVVALRELDEPLERRHVPVHREHPVGHDQGAAPLGLAEAPLQVVHVHVVVNERLRAAEAAAVDDARVVERVGEDDVPLLGERGHHAHVGEVPGAEEQAVVRALERGQLLLQAAVDGHVAGHQPRGPGAGAVSHRRLRGRLAHARMVGQAEVVVRAEEEHRLAVQEHPRALRA
jgi:hypothetical protein